MAGKFTEDSRKLLAYVGGRENIAAVSHCVTRMRFVLNDPSKADTSAIEALPLRQGDIYPGRAVPGDYRKRGQYVLQ